MATRPSSTLPGSGSSPNISLGANGMPRSRTQQQMDDMLMGSGEFMPSPHDISNIVARPQSRAGHQQNSSTRRSSMSSTTSRSNIFPWSRKKSVAAGSGMGAVDFDAEDDDGGVIQFDDGSLGGAPNVGLSDLVNLRDRDRYPTLNGAAGSKPGAPASDAASIRNGGRTMSISSNMSSGGFDTTPYIPTLKSTHSNQQYRKNLNSSRKQAYNRPTDSLSPPPASVRGSVQYGGPGGRQGAMSPGFALGAPGGPPRPYSSNSDARLRSLTGPAPQLDYGPNNNSARTMSMTGNYRPGPPPSMGMPQRNSRPPSRLSSGMSMANGGANMTISENTGIPQYRRVSASTMTDPVASAASSSHSYSSPSTVDLGVQTDNTSIDSPVLAPVAAVAAASTAASSRDLDELNNKHSVLVAEKDKQIKDLQAMNRSLLDEVRLVTSELADSIRRELSLENGGISNSDILPDDESTRSSLAKKVVLLESQIDMERRKRQVAEASLNHESLAELGELYDYLSMERDMAEKDRLYQNEQRENELLRENVERMSNEIDALQTEVNQLKNGIVPDLKNHVKDLEVLTAAGNPIELIKQIEELKVENKTIQALVEKNSTRGPLGEKIKAVEGQRDVLREALRSLREKKDHEVRQTTERVRQLESRLEKERVINHQMQRKLVQTRSAAMVASSPTSSIFPNIDSVSSKDIHNNNGDDYSNGNNDNKNINETTGTGKENIRKFSTGSGTNLQPPNMGFASHEDRHRSSSPVSFEISQEPAWLDYVDPRHRQTAAAKRGGALARENPSAVPLSLPNGRSEQLPLSLGQATS